MTAHYGQATAESGRKAYPIKDFCHVYGVGRSLAYDMIRRGELEARKAGRRTLITAASADRWFASLNRLHGEGVEAA